MGESSKIKAPAVRTNVHPLIQKRWSPLAFSEKEIPVGKMEELFEAASWAASAFNEQPWEYIYAYRGTEGFETLWSCLLPGNQPWAKSASVLIVAMHRNRFEKNGKPNLYAGHDLGMANAQLLLQAVHNDIYGHLMAGFDAEKLGNVLKLDEGLSPVCMGALGYLASPDVLDGSYKTREMSARTRRPVSAFTKLI